MKTPQYSIYWPKFGEYYNFRLEVKYSSIHWTDWNTFIPTQSTSQLEESFILIMN